MKIALIGSYPPPYGGISVHIQRMKEHLQRRGIECIIYDMSGTTKDEDNVVCITNLKKWLPKYFFFAKEDIIHCHSTSWMIRVIIGFMSFLGKKTVITVHGQSLSDSLKKGIWLRKKIIKFAVRHTSFVIADNKQIKDLLLSLGVKSEKVSVITPFVPPDVKEEDHKKVPKYVWNFMNSHKPIISANAFQINFYNGTDLYGLDMIVDLVCRLKKYYQNIGIAICLPNIGDEKYFEKLKQQMKEKRVENNVLFITEPLPEVYPIWKETDLFVRPTCTDGDSLSIREALYFKIPVITSDAVPRPEGVILFKNRDVQDFITMTKNVLDNYKLYKSKVNNLESARGFDRILEVYNELAR